MLTFKSWIKNWMTATFPILPDKLETSLGLPTKESPNWFLSYTEREELMSYETSTPVNNLNCQDLAARLRNAAALGEQKINELRGRERNIRACIADLRTQLRTCQGNVSSCTSNDIIIINQSLTSLEHTIAEMDSILATPC